MRAIWDFPTPLCRDAAPGPLSPASAHPYLLRKQLAPIVLHSQDGILLGDTTTFQVQKGPLLAAAHPGGPKCTMTRGIRRTNVPGGRCPRCEPLWPSSGYKGMTFSRGTWTPSKSKILKGSAAQWSPQPPMQNLLRPGHLELLRASDSLYKRRHFPTKNLRSNHWV